jgi:RNA polymerase subunit RPABC4/transcription elongation factor Spt4
MVCAAAQSGDDVHRKRRPRSRPFGCGQKAALCAREKESLRSLLPTLGLSDRDADELTSFFSEKFDFVDLERKVRYFQGDKTQSLAYAFSVLSSDGRQLGRSQKNFLLKLAAASGIEEGTAAGLLRSVAERKRFFRERSGLHLCSNCAFVYPVAESFCPSCRIAANSVVRIDEDANRRVCGGCGLIFPNSDFETCPRCGGEKSRVFQAATIIT